MNRKGISPLVATTLIIAFTVCLSTIVMTWDGSFMKQQEEQIRNDTVEEIECEIEILKEGLNLIENQITDLENKKLEIEEKLRQLQK